MDVYRGADKVAELGSYDELRIGASRPAFIYDGNELVYPSPVKDGLVLWYDFSGRTNDDAQRNVAEDLSGNGNHGTLQNFNYTAESGYDKNGLLFDGVDDFIDVPIEELNLNYNNMTAQIDDKIYSYKDGQVLHTKLNDEKTELDGIEVGGRNHFVDHLMIDSSNYEYIRNYHYYTLDNLSPNKTYTVSVKENFDNDITIPRSGNRALRINNDKTESIGENIINVSESDGVQIWKRQIKSNENGQLFIVNFQPSLLMEIQEMIKIEKGNIAADWTPAPEDTEAKITMVQEQNIQSYKLYNRALTEDEIIHNYAIEKERFGIE